MVLRTALTTRLVGAAASVVFVAGLMTVAARGPAPVPPGAAEEQRLPVAEAPRRAPVDEPVPLDFGNDAAPPPAPPPAAPPARPRDPGDRDEPPGDGAGRHDSVGWNEPDGRPGYSTGFGGCYQPREAVRHDPPPDDLLFEVTPVRAAARPGERVVAIATVTNTGSRRVHGWLSEPRATLIDASGRAVSAVFWTDAMRVHSFDLAPGESDGFAVAAPAASCGDTALDDDPPLPEGDYDLVVRAPWHDVPERGPTRSGTLVTARVPVTVAADAEPAPCESDDDGCWTHGWARSPGRCAENERSGAEYGARDGLSLRLVVDDDAVRPGERVTARAVVRNDGERPFSLLLFASGDGQLAPAGGVLGGGPGPLGTGDPVPGGRWLAEQDPLGRVLRIAPGASASVPVVAETKSCDGAALPEGSYRLGSELYVAFHGWWAAPGVPVTVTAA